MSKIIGITKPIKKLMGVSTLHNYYSVNKVHSIGIPGTMGFGVGICPAANLPAGMTPLPGYDQPWSDNYGNYQFSDGSIMVFIPKFYYRIANALSLMYATYGVNALDILGVADFQSSTEANAAGYALHRAFIDGGSEKPGFFFDKYMCSKVAHGAGFTAASIANGLPLSSTAAHNPFSGCTGGANAYYSAIDLAHRRDGTDGAVNASSIFHCASIFQRAALAMLSLAHGQAAAVNGTGTAYCAWYHATNNFPKGLNNNQAPVAGVISSADVNDTSISFTSDGYDRCGKTGSGSPFAKTTHNGQTCGVADVNGLMWEISIGVTCIATSPAIEAMTQENPCKIKVTGHGLVDGNYVQPGGITQADWSGCKDKIWTVTRIDDDNFTIPFDASGFGTPYDAGTDPGTITKGKWYVAKEATAMKSFTAGATGATDHWGATGVAAMMQEFAPLFETSSGGAFVQRMGSGANQVLAEDISGAEWLLTSMGLPKDANGIDTTGTDLFGKDYFYQYIRDQLCLVSSGGWNITTNAGVWSVDWSTYRTYSISTVGFRAACYPD